MTLNPANHAPDHIPALDGLRGLAVLLVLGLHTAFPSSREPVLRLGWIGVDLFFVLSGFLITRNLLATRNSHRFFSNFYARRILRIWPVYFALLTLVFVLERYGFFHARATLVAWICLLTFTQNFYMGGFGWLGVPEWLEPTWSLAIEEQFYLLWPFLVRMLSFRALKCTCMGAILVSPVLRAIVAANVQQEDAATVLTFCRFDSLCFGTLLAILASEQKFKYGRRLLDWSLPALLVFFAIERWASPVFFQAIGFSLLAVAFTGMVALCATPVGSPTLRKEWTAVLTFSPLRFAGRISYCLYLVHTAVFAIAASHPAQRILLHIPFYDPQGWSQVGVNWFLAFLVSTLSWHLFESPILRLKRNFAERSATAETAVATNV